MLGRRYRYDVYQGTAGALNFGGVAVLLDTWIDGPVPSFTVGEDGAGPLTVAFARVWGAADEPAEGHGGGGALACGNRVVVQATDDWSLAATALSNVIYQGTIEEVDFEATAAGWMATVQLLSLTRIAAQSAIQTAVSLSGDALVCARTLFTNYGAGLGWDPTNATTSGVTIAATAPANTTFQAALAFVAQTAGEHFHSQVSPQGLIRVFDDTNATTHTLRHGGEAGEVTALKIRKSNIGRADKVLVAFSDSTGTPQVVTSVSGTHSNTDPRDVWAPLPQRVPAAQAQQWADAQLRDRNRTMLAGSATVLASRYPIDSIRIGDLVTIYVPRDLPVGADTLDPGQVTMRVSQIQYAGDSVGLDFEQEHADMSRFFADIQTAQSEALRGSFEPEDIAGRINASAGGINGSKLTAASVTTTELGGAAVTNAKVNDVDASKVTGTIATSQIAASAITDAKIADMAATKLSGTVAAARLPNQGTHADGTTWADATAQGEYNGLLAKLRTANLIS